MARKRTGRRISGDPRKAGGDIAGPGGPWDRRGVVIDTTDAVLLDHSTTALVEAYGGEHRGPVLALLLDGRINKTSDRSRVLYLLNGDGAAALVTELVGLAVRIGPEFAAAFHHRLRQLEETPDA